MTDLCLADLLENTKDGEWGQGEGSADSVPMLVIRGTDFSAVRYGDLSTVPLRYIPSTIATRKQLQPGDILIETAGGTKDQPTGRTVLLKQSTFLEADKPITCASFSRFLRVKPDLIRPDYLFWFLQYLYFSGDMYAYHVQHTGVARFQYTEFARQTVIPRPSFHEQEGIASVLNALDEKIELNRSMNRTLQALARGIFKDWFVDFGPTRAKQGGLSPYGDNELWALFPDSLDSDDTPQGWEKSQIGAEAQCVGGTTPSTTDSRLWNGDINWATPKDLSLLEAPVLLSTQRTISQAGVAVISSGLLPAGTVLLSSRAPIGYIAIAEIPVAINQGFIALVCDGRLSNIFVWQWIIANMEAILQKANGSTFQEISKTNFRPLPMIIPSTQLLKAFEQIVRPLYHNIRDNEIENTTLAQMRDRLLPKLISGEIRLKDAEKKVEEML